MTSEGVKIRAQIDSESVRNVMIVNGGGSVALIALLPNILYTPLVLAVLLTLSAWLIGLTLAVVHSVLRRKCSLVFEQNNMDPPAGEPRFGIKPKEPWVCWWSLKTMYASIAAFVVGGAIMVVLSFGNIDQLTNSPHNKCMQSDQNARNGMVLSVSKGSFSAAHRNLLGVRSVPTAVIPFTISQSRYGRKSGLPSQLERGFATTPGVPP